MRAACAHYPAGPRDKAVVLLWLFPVAFGGLDPSGRAGWRV